ncbi:ABC transporter permease [Rathayibacter oskolensis]|uniref:ABC transporter permease n=1 Tax=Rathayibacter oskolensis TaxID=1891671 RepID=UPI00265DF6F2|nr:ABC transporter permease [Rathayibacter oskolensis]WKK73137.1 ABC transporter permease [Rathayibacter oskolensis]
MATTDVATIAPRPRLERRPLRTILARPETGALVAALAVLVFFSLSTPQFLSLAGAGVWLESASTFGVMAVAVAMLMIGGEFDLSAGVMTGFSALIVGVLTTHYGLSIWVAVVVSLVACLGVGALNGILVMKTGLPSFIVTLGTFFALAGIDLAVTKIITGQVAIQGMTKVPAYDSIQPLFGSSLAIGNGTFYVSVLWWFVVTAVATWILLRTRAGNWIFAVGGALTSARQIGVPVLKTKIGLFMGTAGAAWLVGMISLFRTSTVQANTGVGQEFIYIICAVVGGCLMTGGYGSAIGAALGALIYGMVFQGITFAGWDTDWLRTVLGGMLLAAVLLNNFVRTRAGGRR